MNKMQWNQLQGANSINHVLLLAAFKNVALLQKVPNQD